MSESFDVEFSIHRLNCKNGISESSEQRQTKFYVYYRASVILKLYISIKTRAEYVSETLRTRT